METIVVNLYGGPGVGKSTIMAGVFCALKKQGVNAEIAPEFVKELVWEHRTLAMDDNIYIFAKQLHRIKRLVGQVEVVICDSPLHNPIVYEKEHNEHFDRLVREQFSKFNTMNYFIERSTEYMQSGRNQNEEEARQIDARIKEVISDIDYKVVDKDAAEFIIIDDILKRLNKF